MSCCFCTAVLLPTYWVWRHHIVFSFIYFNFVYSFFTPKKSFRLQVLPNNEYCQVLFRQVESERLFVHSNLYSPVFRLHVNLHIPSTPFASFPHSKTVKCYKSPPAILLSRLERAECWCTIQWLKYIIRGVITSKWGCSRISSLMECLLSNQKWINRSTGSNFFTNSIIYEGRSCLPTHTYPHNRVCVICSWQYRSFRNRAQ